MGILNVTPDSFSGDGSLDVATSVAHAAAHALDGADLIDVGAESTRPGYVPIDAQTERERLIPVVRALRAAQPGALLSIDTFKADVFAAAHRAGGDMLNSIWGLNDALLNVARACDAPIVIMHNKRVAVYEGDVVDEVIGSLERDAARATAAGIPPEHVILDPGIGFGKTADHNLAVLASLGRLVALGYPTLVGTSRKSTIGRLTGRDVGSRGYGTAATIALAIAAGVDMIRVHDVSAARDVARTTDAIVRGWRPNGWTDALQER